MSVGQNLADERYDGQAEPDGRYEEQSCKKSVENISIVPQIQGPEAFVDLIAVTF